MSRRTMLLAAMVALAGCQGPNSTTNSAFKLPTPSFDLLAPYGPPRIPAPGTYSYGQPGIAAPAAASAAPYYPGSTNARGVSLPQSPEQGDPRPAAPAIPPGKVAQAVWKSSAAEGQEAAATQATLASHDAPAAADQAVMQVAAAEPGTILIPETAPQPAEAAPLLLNGMRAHDLTAAVAQEQQQAAMLAMATSPAAHLPTQVIYSAPLSTPGTVVVPSAAAATTVVIPSAATPTAASAGTSGGMVEITDLPAATPAAPASSGSLQRVRGYEPPASGAGIVPPVPDNFIAPQNTISSDGAAAEARDAVATATVESEPAIIKPAAPVNAAGWKSRFSTDES